MDNIKEMKAFPVVIGFSLSDLGDIMMHIQKFNPMAGGIEERIWTVPFKLERNL